MAAPGAARNALTIAGMGTRALMPELPEVETERGRLAERVAGRTIAAAHIADSRLTRPEDPAWIAATLEGAAVEAVERRGKYLVVRLASGQVLLVHLRMTGGFRYEPATHERAVLELDDGTRIAYRDLRRFGTWLARRGGRGGAASRGQARSRAARPALHRSVPRRPSRGASRTRQGGDPRPTDSRRARKHLRRRSLVARADPPAAPGRGALRRRGRGTQARRPSCAPAWHPPPGRRPRRRRVRGRADAARVPRLRAHR